MIGAEQKGRDGTPDQNPAKMNLLTIAYHIIHYNKVEAV